MFRASLRLRAINVGQDRYRRTYWVLPLTGGVYAEGMESGDPEQYEKAQVAAVQVKTEVQEEEEEVKAGAKIEEGGADEEEEKEHKHEDEDVVKKEAVDDDVGGEQNMKAEEKGDEDQKMEKSKEKGHIQDMEGEAMEIDSSSLGSSKASIKQTTDSDASKEHDSAEEKMEIEDTTEEPKPEEVAKSKTDVADLDNGGAVKGDDSVTSHEKLETGEKFESVTDSSEVGGVKKQSSFSAVDNVKDGENVINSNGDCVSNDGDYMDEDNDDHDYDSVMNDSVDEKTENGLEMKGSPSSEAQKSKLSTDIARDVSVCGAKDSLPHVNGDIFNYPPTIDSSNGTSPLCVTVSLSSPSSDNTDVSLTKKQAPISKLSEEQPAMGPLSLQKTPRESISLSSEATDPSPSVKISESLTVAVSLADPNSDSPMLVKTIDASLEKGRPGAKGVVVDLDALSSDPKQNNADLIPVDKSTKVMNGWTIEEVKEKDVLLSPLKNCSMPNSSRDEDASLSATNLVIVSDPPCSDKVGLESPVVPTTAASEIPKARPSLPSEGSAKLNEHSADEGKEQKETTNSDIGKDQELISSGSTQSDKEEPQPGSKVGSQAEIDSSEPLADTQQKSKPSQDILKVPHVPASPKGLTEEVQAGETLVSILNYSIQQAYMEDDQGTAENEENKELNATKEEGTAAKNKSNNGSESVSLITEEKSQAWSKSPPKSTPSSLVESAAGSAMPPSTSSLLSSSLLFSAIPKLTQSLNVTTTTMTNCGKSERTTKSVLAESLSRPAPLSLKVTPRTTALPVTPKSGKSKSESSSFLEGTNNHLVSVSSASLQPIPAHSRPINPQPLPPFHPSAQTHTALDLTPPAAHSSNKHKSSLPLSVFPSVPLPSSHRGPPQNKGYMPGLPHPYHFGPTSASETLSSLASIVSPPPAHQQQPHRFTPTTTKTTTSSSTPVPTPLSSSTPKSSLISQNNIGDSSYSSSELLQQAASHVRRTAEGKKLSPALLSHMAASTTAGSISSAALSLSPHKSHGTSTSPSSPRGAASSAASKEDFLSAYSVPPSHSMSLSPASSSASLSPSRGGGSHQQINSTSGSRPHTPLSASTPSSNAEIVDHSLWFSILPRAPCDDQSVTVPTSQQHHHQQLINSSNSAAAAATNLLMTLSTSTSALSSLLSSPTLTTMAGTTGSPNPGSLDSLLPVLQANPSLLTQEMILQLLQSPSQPGSGRQSPCGSQGLDSSGDFKVPPPRDMTPLPDPWDLLRAAQGEAQPIPKSK